MAKPGPKPKYRDFVWSPNFAYAIGLMASDGSLSNDERHLSFVSKDLEQIENFLQCLSLNITISKCAGSFGKGEKLYYRAQWGDVALYEYFLSLGFTANKSLIISALRIPDELFFDFLRGDFDGDGCFYSYFDPRWKSSFMFYLNFVSASKTHILWIKNTVERLCGARGHLVFTNKKNGMWKLAYAKKETLLILSKMYQAADCTCLSRKRLKIEAALRIVNKSIGDY